MTPQKAPKNLRSHRRLMIIQISSLHMHRIDVKHKIMLYYTYYIMPFSDDKVDCVGLNWSLHHFCQSSRNYPQKLISIFYFKKCLTLKLFALHIKTTTRAKTQLICGWSPSQMIKHECLKDDVGFVSRLGHIFISICYKTNMVTKHQFCH